MGESKTSSLYCQFCQLADGFYDVFDSNLQPPIVHFLSRIGWKSLGLEQEISTHHSFKNLSTNTSNSRSLTASIASSILSFSFLPLAISICFAVSGRNVKVFLVYQPERVFTSQREGNKFSQASAGIPHSPKHFETRKHHHHQTSLSPQSPEFNRNSTESECDA